MLAGATTNEDLAYAARKNVLLDSMIILHMNKSDVTRNDVDRNLVDLDDSFRTASRKQAAYIAELNGEKPKRDRPSRSKRIGRGAPNVPRTEMARELNRVYLMVKSRKEVLEHMLEWCKENNQRASYASIKKAVQRRFNRDTIG
jgi:sugar-specific transcriptional regulator TrmB